MRRICLIIQRYGKTIVGGAEQLARCYAQLLKQFCEVHVATTCALDYTIWANELPAGITDEEGVLVHRFPTDFEQGEDWHRLYELLLLRHLVKPDVYSPAPPKLMDWPAFWHEPERKRAVQEAAATLPRAIQEAFIRLQGPYSTPLLDFLEAEQDHFDWFMFFSYLFPTTYFGFCRIPRQKRLLVPTLHDEPAAYLPVYAEMLRQFHGLLFNCAGESQLAQQIVKHGLAPGHVFGVPINAVAPDTKTIEKFTGPYVLYCGRMDAAKGTNVLFDYFIRFKQEYPSPLKLVLTGQAVENVPKHPDILYLGFVNAAQKSALMKNAQVFLHPSAFESFSIVLLEAFLAGTPALVNSNSLVMSDHCRAAAAGLDYGGYGEFAECLSQLLEAPELRRRLGQNGSAYVEQNYTAAIIAGKLRQLLATSQSDGISQEPV
jgi:glycosyltransferase involved in cell wall biosynthesis